MSTSRSIIVLLLVAVAASPREAVVVPVGPKTRNESWVESETQTYGVVRQQNFTYFGYHASPWRSFAGRRSGMSKPAFVRWLADSKYGGRRDDSARTRRKIWISTQVAGKRLYHPVKCTADAKLGALARGMAQGHNSMETMSTRRQDMLVGALEGFLEDLPSS